MGQLFTGAGRRTLRPRPPAGWPRSTRRCSTCCAAIRAPNGSPYGGGRRSPPIRSARTTWPAFRARVPPCARIPAHAPGARGTRRRTTRLRGPAPQGAARRRRRWRLLDARRGGRPPPADAARDRRAAARPRDRDRGRPAPARSSAQLSGAGAGTTDYLVTDGGVKYPLPSAAALTQLGYDGVEAAGRAGGLLTLLPTGPSLDPKALAAQGIVASTAVKPCGG